eukprot:6174320-Pleurochrysis_carterae.AAC.3
MPQKWARHKPHFGKALRGALGVTALGGFLKGSVTPVSSIHERSKCCCAAASSPTHFKHLLL